MLGDPNMIAGMLSVASVVALLFMLPAGHWSTPVVVMLWSAAAAGAVFAVVSMRSAGRRPIPGWILHAMYGAGNVLVSVVVAIAATQQVNMANLYLLSTTGAILLFSFRAALAHVGVSGVYYAAVLAADALDVGHGHGPVHHLHALWPRGA